MLKHIKRPTTRSLRLIRGSGMGSLANQTRRNKHRRVALLICWNYGFFAGDSLVRPCVQTRRVIRQLFDAQIKNRRPRGHPAPRRPDRARATSRARLDQRVKTTSPHAAAIIWGSVRVAQRIRVRVARTCMSRRVSCFPGRFFCKIGESESDNLCLCPEAARKLRNRAWCKNVLPSFVGDFISGMLMILAECVTCDFVIRT